jgi:hypothetical protein
LTSTWYCPNSPFRRESGPLIVTTTEADEADPWQEPHPVEVDFNVLPATPPGYAERTVVPTTTIATIQRRCIAIAVNPHNY